MKVKRIKKTGRKRRGVMGRSDIPYAQRLKMQQHTDVDGTVVAYADEDGKAVMPSRARKEGWAQDGKT